MKLVLPYGASPCHVDLGGRDVRVLEAARLAPPPPVRALLEHALDAPIGAPPLSAATGARVTVIVSDATRDEPRAEMLEALRDRLPGTRWTIAVATGTHGPCNLDALGLPPSLVAGARIVNHDGHRDEDLVELGRTSRGTPVRVHRCVVDADLVVATGCIRPHYFAGFGAGGKAIFPGLGEARAIRLNHRFKTEPGARAGAIDGNPCRADLDEAVALVPTPTFLLNGACGPDGAVHAAVAGDLQRAWRAGADRIRPWFTVHAARAPVVIASDVPPVTSSLYQAAKIAAAAAPLVADGGLLVLVAECSAGIGPLDTVNEAIFRIGVLPRLPPGARIALVSSMSPDEVARTLVSYASGVNEAIAASPGPVLAIPRASLLLCEQAS